MTLRLSSAAVSCIYLCKPCRCYQLSLLRMARRWEHHHRPTATAVAKTSKSLKYTLTWTRNAVILEHCSKSVINFSIGDTCCYEKFNYPSLLLLQTYIASWDFRKQWHHNKNRRYRMWNTLYITTTPHWTILIFHFSNEKPSSPGIYWTTLLIYTAVLVLDTLPPVIQRIAHCPETESKKAKYSLIRVIIDTIKTWIYPLH